MVLVAGTHYAGEIKKSIFTVLNAPAAAEGRVPDALLGQRRGERATWPCSSACRGTGKTTLSADPDRRLIGDDEHGWSRRRRVQHRGRVLREDDPLSAEKEPQIYARPAVRQRAGERPARPGHPPAGLRQPAVHREHARRRTRSTYIPNHEPSGRGGHPQTVFFLTCDAFGVLPPIARLTPEQAMDHFLCGYTAKVAGTEVGVKEPTGRSSAPASPRRSCRCRRSGTRPCCGEKLKRHQVPVWLVNTGWTGGGYGVG